MKKLLSMVLVLALSLGLAAPALAYSTPDFSDVPQSHWAYAAIMEMADAGIIQGTGGGRFSPAEPLSAEMFITLVGRVMFPEIKAQGDDWSGPYVAAAKDRGFLARTNITDETLGDEISRYDMAVILAWCSNTLGGIADLSSSSGIIDLDEMPYWYAVAVEFVCAAGLIRGDENHRFNGANSMTRQEAAVVIHRLSLLKHNLEGDFPTALTVKGHALSVADMDYYYHNALITLYEQERMLEILYNTNGLGYTPSFDPLISLKTQYVDEDKTQSYHDYFLDQAKTNVSQVLALSDAARAHGYTMSPEGQTALEEASADLDKQVKQYGFHSRESYLKSVYDLRMTEAVYFKNLELGLLAQEYWEAQVNALGGYSEEALTAYYSDHVGELNSYDYDYVWFDGEAEEDADSAAALADAKKRAESMLAALQSSDGSSDAFSKAAKAQGTYSSTVTAAQGCSFSAAPYAPWMMDPSRRDGDTALFLLDDQAYYVVQFHKAYRDDTPRVDFRHILLRTQTEDGDPLPDEQAAQAGTRARELLAQFLDGPQTAEAFGALADRYSEDARNWKDDVLNAPGGLYEEVKWGDTVQPIDDWCLAPQRQPGDTALVQSEFGWHVMYFQGWCRPVWMDQAEEDMERDAQDALMSQVLAGYEVQEGPGWGWVGLDIDEIT